MVRTSVNRRLKPHQFSYDTRDMSQSHTLFSPGIFNCKLVLLF